MRRIIKELRKKVTDFNPELSSKIMYFVKFKRKLNLNNPKTFNEKINWIKLKYLPNQQLIVDCTDKYKVRNYVKDRIGEKYLTQLYGVWDAVDEIDFEQLPQKFVLKCNHGCGYNIICKNKNELSIEKTKEKLNAWMNEDFGKISGELHYSKIKKKIICEEFLEKDILDYKFFCFNGIPKCFYISQNVNGDFHNMQADFFNINGTLADFVRIDHRRFDKLPELPDNYETMVNVCKEMSKEFEFVRVDLYNVAGKIYFSELTFSPCSGYMPLHPFEADIRMGNLINLDRYKKELDCE